ncbi:hypothetical protein DRE_06087 [Drechslerella stenobrocha 248]|uniref:Uncharacterized protein n=1 Tax=Drechslerella stenobrocha 248 TaxID=1043628 RepID=W7HPY6_9PEZI|nr:hypothetical protein DRE_06087 [Drechslerella stenobrocha 248]
MDDDEHSQSPPTAVEPVQLQLEPELEPELEVLGKNGDRESNIGGIIVDGDSALDDKNTDDTNSEPSKPSSPPLPLQDSNPHNWDPLLKVTPKVDPDKPPEPFSMCPHCRRVEAGLCQLSPLGELPATQFYRFRDEENRLPALENLPPTRHYRFDNSADEGTARVYPDPIHKYELGRLPFIFLLPLIVLNLAYLAWLVADLCYSYGPYTRFKPYFTSGSMELNRGMEIFAGVFLFLTNMGVICKLVFHSPHYAGPSFSSASRGDKKWIARMSLFGCLPVVMLIIVAAIRKNVPLIVAPQRTTPTCDNMGYPTVLQFEALDHAAVRGNRTARYNSVTVFNSTFSGRFSFDTIYDPEELQNNFVLTKLDGNARNATISYFLQSRQYTFNWHSNATDAAGNSIQPEYIGGSWQEVPSLAFQNVSPQLQSKKLDRWQAKAFSDGSYLELFAVVSAADTGESEKKKAWFRTLDREYNTQRTYMRACATGGVEDVATLVPAGMLLIEFAKNVYDTTG